MPLNEIPKYFDRDTRRLVDVALEDAWQELKKDGLADTALTRRKLASTIVALASVGETDSAKLKWFAIHGARGALQAETAKARKAQKTVQAAETAA
jgi:hypothetical protein